LSALIHFILGTFVKKRNLKESAFVLTIKTLSLGYFMLLIFFSVHTKDWSNLKAWSSTLILCTYSCCLDVQ